MPISVRAAILAVVAAAFCFAQSSPSNLQPLEVRLRQLEDMMKKLQDEMQSVQKELTAAQQAQKAQAAPTPPRAPAAQPPAPPAYPDVTPPPLPVTYIGTETRTRQTDDDFPVEAPRINNEELDPTLRGYIRMPGTQTLMRFSGFVKTDFFYDLNVAGLWYGGMVPSSFPSSPQPGSKNSTVSIRPSRFVAEFRQPLKDDTLKVFVDWDVYGTLGRNTPNLRSFWGQYKNFLAGQTWSAFGDPDAFPDTLDFHGPPGMMGLRTPQFRYTYPINRHHTIGGSVDKSGTDIPMSTFFGTPIGTQLWPDFVGFYRYENNHGHLHTAAILRSVGGFVPHTTIPDLKAHVTGYGASVSGAWRLGRLRDNVVFQGIGGRGIANYYNDNYGLGSDVGFDARGRVVATPTWSASGGYQHYWTKNVRSTAAFGYLRINNTAGDPDTNYHVSRYAAGNIIYQPSALFLMGAEFSYASLRRKNDFEWIARRIQLSVSFFFNRYPTPE
jgi:hypothetical protein